MRANHYEIPDGTPGLRIKLVHLRQLVEESKRDPAFRKQVLRIVRNVREGDWSGELGAISNWIRTNVTYRHDPVNVELFTAPHLLAGDAAAGDAAAGDCDDMVALGAAMAEVLGHPTRFVVGGDRDTRGGERWRHIWRESWDKGRNRWVAFDDTAKKRPTGWSPASRYQLTGVTSGRSTATVAGMSTRVGLPCCDEYGQIIPGMAQLVDAEDIAGGGSIVEGLGFMKSITRSVKRVGRTVDQTRRKTAVKVLGRRNVSKLAKVGRQVAPIAGALVNVVPGVGQVASAAIAVAIANDKRIQAKKAMRAQEAAWAAEDAAYAAEEARMMRPAIVTSGGEPMAMGTQPPRQGGAVFAVPGADVDFNEEYAPDAIDAATPPQYAPDDLWQSEWPDASEATLGMIDWGGLVQAGMQAGVQAYQVRQQRRAMRRGGIGAAGGANVMPDYSAALTTAAGAVGKLVGGVTARPAPRVAPQAAAAGGGGGIMILALAAGALLLLRRR